MLLSKYAVCDCKKSKFIKQQEASGLLSSLEIKTPLSKIPLNFLLASDKFMLEIRLRQPGFRYSACAPFKERIQRKNKKN